MAVENTFEILIYPGLHSRPGKEFVNLCMELSAKFALRVRRSCVSRAPIGMLVYCHLQMHHPVFFIELLTEFYFRLRDMVSQPERYFLRQSLFYNP